MSRCKSYLDAFGVSTPGVNCFQVYTKELAMTTDTPADADKDIIRTAPGLPAGYMLVRKDYLTELHRDRAQTMAVYRHLHAKYVSAARDKNISKRNFNEGLDNHATLKTTPSKWIKTNERQPNQAGWYLVVVPTRWGDNDNMVTMGYYHYMSGEYWTLESDAQVEAAGNPTHWQPLPELPEELA